MNFFTHIAMSKALYRCLEKRMELDKHGFIYGNVKPDLLPAKQQKPHMLEYCLEEVSALTDSLMRNKKSLRDFSVALGEVCHYTSDFFCDYHVSASKYYRLMDHLGYELLLHFSFLKMAVTGLFPTTADSGFGSNIETVIRARRARYSALPDSRIKDIHFALSTSLLICERVACCRNQTQESILAISEEESPCTAVYL